MVICYRFLNFALKIIWILWDQWIQYSPIMLCSHLCISYLWAVRKTEQYINKNSWWRLVSLDPTRISDYWTKSFIVISMLCFLQVMRTEHGDNKCFSKPFLSESLMATLLFGHKVISASPLQIYFSPRYVLHV